MKNLSLMLGMWYSKLELKFIVFYGLLNEFLRA